MGKNSEERHTGSKLDSLKKELEIDIAEREREAKEKLDDLLSEKKMEFCSRCGRKISSRTDWAGKCIWEDCDSLVCRDCWDVSKYKFCSKHSREVVDEDEEVPKKKEIFREEDDPEIKVDLSDVLDEHEESRKSKLQYYASEYSIWLRKRMEQAPVDWTPTKCIDKARFKSEKMDGDYVTEVYNKKWFWKKTGLTIIVSAYDSKGDFDGNSLNAYLHKTARKLKGYKIFVLVSDGAGIEITHFVNRFSDSAFALLLAEPKKGHLNYNIKDPLTTSYSEWFNKKKEPLNFIGRLKKAGETVSDRTVVSEKAAMKEFGFEGREVHGVMKSCKLLDPVKGTDTYLLKN